MPRKFSTGNPYLITAVISNFRPWVQGHEDFSYENAMDDACYDPDGMWTREDAEKLLREANAYYEQVVPLEQERRRNMPEEERSILAEDPDDFFDLWRMRFRDLMVLLQQKLNGDYTTVAEGPIMPQWRGAEAESEEDSDE